MTRITTIMYDFFTCAHIQIFFHLTFLFEDTALKIPKAWADELGWKVKQALEKSKPPKSNISKEREKPSNRYWMITVSYSSQQTKAILLW